jgi:phospholipid/cholesterol/gamma-HCH transport system ATP-binding protein
MEIIRFDHFHKKFSGKTIHEDVSFSVQAKECLGLIGGSGAGKSVILRSLIGLERPDRGKIIVHGTDITTVKEQNLTALRKRVAYVFQNGALFDSMTVFDNVAYTLREHTQMSETQVFERVMEQLREFNLEHASQLMPSELSGGMQKRVGLARGIVMNPDVVLYDEPTAGLDPLNTIGIQNLIIKLKNKGVTSILVTHDVDTALAVCDRICLLQRGIIQETPNIEELRADRNKFMNLFLRGENG